MGEIIEELAESAAEGVIDALAIAVQLVIEGLGPGFVRRHGGEGQEQYGAEHEGKGGFRHPFHRSSSVYL